MVFENLHGKVGKTQAVKVMADMAERGSLTCKEFGKQKIYWITQVLLRDLHSAKTDSEQTDSTNLADLDKQINSLEAEKESLVTQTSELSSGFRHLQLISRIEKDQSQSNGQGSQ